MASPKKHGTYFNLGNHLTCFLPPTLSLRGLSASTERGESCSSENEKSLAKLGVEPYNFMSSRISRERLLMRESMAERLGLPEGGRPSRGEPRGESRKESSSQLVLLSRKTKRSKILMMNKS